MPAKRANAATAFQRVRRALERQFPAWGIDPVPEPHRRLGSLDFAVLWGDLSVGLLVMLTGALLVPALGFTRALLAIALGSALGCIPLALVGVAGAREGVPGMVLFRPVLGTRGSYVPTVFNIVQLVGWTGFELWAMALVADQVSRTLFGFSSYWLWLAVVAVLCTALALGGPLVVVRAWLERFGAWVVIGVGAWISFRLLSSADLGALWGARGQGGLPFWLAVDLVIAMPVSWLPLVADYNRFARFGVSSAAGSYVGYAVGNAWFYTVGAVLVLVGGLASDKGPSGLGHTIAGVAGGWAVLLALLVGETDEAFADIYSAAVSSQNLEGRVRQRVAVLGVAAAGVALAAWLGLRQGVALGNYEAFLFLMGSVFVPLFGVFVADYFVLRRGRQGGAVNLGPDRSGGTLNLNGRAFVSWALGFLLYQWSVPTGPAAWQDLVRELFRDWLHLPFPLAGSRAGASIPSFFLALLVYVLLERAWRPGTSRSTVSR